MSTLPHLVNTAILPEVLRSPQNFLRVESRGQASDVDKIALDNAHGGQVASIDRRCRPARPRRAAPAPLLLLLRQLLPVQMLQVLLMLVVVAQVQCVLLFSGGRSGGGGAGRVRVFLLRALLFSVLDDLVLVDGRESVRIVRVLRPTRRAEIGVVLLDAVPAPHAHSVSARTRHEVLVRQIHGLAAQRAHNIVAIVRVLEGVGHDGLGARDTVRPW